MSTPISHESSVLREITALTTCTMTDMIVVEVKGTGQNGMVVSAGVRKVGFPLPPSYRVALKVLSSFTYPILMCICVCDPFPSAI